ncbi:hypothetical protein REPUB_Repub08aG0016500 [Reevesia pubescens]
MMLIPGYVYAFVMCPGSLPKLYQDFIQKTASVAAPVYKALRENCRGGPVDVASISAYLYSRGKSNLKLQEFPSIIPCSVIHPDTNSCVAHNAKAASATFKKTFPLYFSLTFVPFVVLHLQKFIDTPACTCWLAVKGAVRSTSFLSAFVGISQDHKLVDWVVSGLSALSVLLEKKHRHSELALYVLPQAGESLWYTLVNRSLLPDVKNAELCYNVKILAPISLSHESFFVGPCENHAHS